MIQRGSPARRAGYTFIELMMVIAIIAVLVALLLGGITKVLGLQARTEVTSELNKLAQSLETARNEYGHIAYLPSRLILHNDKNKYRDPDNTVSATPVDGVNPQALTKRTAAVLQAMFGRRVFQKNASPPKGIDGDLLNWTYSGNKNDTKILVGSEVLVFYLGGMPASDGTLRTIGFSNDPLDPTSTSTTDRKGPYFEFKGVRLKKGPSGAFFVYLDPFPIRSGQSEQPYAYFGAYSANDYAPVSIYGASQINTDNDSLLGLKDAYFSSGSGANKAWLAKSKYQIISAGRDKVFGPGGMLPTGGATNSATKDNLTNFSSTELENPVE